MLQHGDKRKCHTCDFVAQLYRAATLSACRQQARYRALCTATWVNGNIADNGSHLATPDPSDISELIHDPEYPVPGAAKFSRRRRNLEFVGNQLKNSAKLPPPPLPKLILAAVFGGVLKCHSPVTDRAPQCIQFIGCRLIPVLLSFHVGQQQVLGIC